MKSLRYNSKYFLLPVAGVVCYALLYFIAALLYPGGTHEHPASKGYSWTENYWCNLLSENAINGQPNPASPVAFFAMVIVCLSVLMFWWLIISFSDLQSGVKRLLKACALLSMAISIFIFTPYHDAVINVAGGFGVIVLIACYYILYKRNDRMLFLYGIFTFLLMVVNNIMYHGGWFHWLPVVQKFTIFFFLLWIVLVCIKQKSYLQLPAILPSVEKLY